MQQNSASRSIDPPGESGDLLTAEVDYVIRARKGDGPAFTWLFSQYNASICAYLAGLVGNSETGHDLAQETFISAWQNLPYLRNERQFKAWLYRIATNSAYAYLRRERLIRWLPWREQAQPDRSSPLLIEGPEVHAGEGEAISRILARLAPRTRMCLLLQLVAGLSQREIASVLHISEKSVSAQVSRGREQFRQLYHQAKGDTSQ